MSELSGTTTANDGGAEAHERPSQQGRAGRDHWIVRWKDVIASKPELPGVWRRRDGGFHVRARVIDPRTNKMREVNRELPDVAKPREAFAWLQAELEKIRSGKTPEAAPSAKAFHEYSAEVFARKLSLGKIRSAAGRAKWDSVLKHHLVRLPPRRTTASRSWVPSTRSRRTSTSTAQR